MNRRLSTLLLALCLLGFLLGVWGLFRLRFEAGDIYPEYSSLRADPLGTMAFYESLERISGLELRRDYSSENRLPERPSATYLHLAASRWSWQSLPSDLIGEIQQFTARGGRLVVTFLPDDAAPFRMLSGSRTAPLKPPTTKGTNAPAAKASKKSAAVPGTVALKDRLGVDLGWFNATNNTRLVAERRADLPLPERLAWHGRLSFQNLDPAWKVIYACDTNAMVIERKLGAGSIVMASDSFFLSNEALARARHADLLAWLIGPSSTVYFDEAHLGVAESTGVASLMRKYRLHWPVAALVLVALLFVWKNSANLAGPPPAEETPDAVAGKEAGAGFVNLLRRNLPKREVVRTCFEEWTKALGQESRHTLTRVDAAQTIIERDAERARVDHDPVRVYNDICRALKAHAHRRKTN